MRQTHSFISFMGLSITFILKCSNRWFLTKIATLPDAFLALACDFLLVPNQELPRSSIWSSCDKCVSFNEIMSAFRVCRKQFGVYSLIPLKQKGSAVLTGWAAPPQHPPPAVLVEPAQVASAPFASGLDRFIRCRNPFLYFRYSSAFVCT